MIEPGDGEEPQRIRQHSNRHRQPAPAGKEHEQTADVDAGKRDSVKPVEPVWIGSTWWRVGGGSVEQADQGAKEAAGRAGGIHQPSSTDGWGLERHTTVR